MVKELFAQTNSEQTQHTQTHTHTHRDTQARNHDNNILLFFLQNPEKKAHIGVDKYRSVQHISVYESNALKLQKLFNVLNSESHRSAIRGRLPFPPTPHFFTQNLTAATFVFLTIKRTSAWPCQKPLRFLLLRLYHVEASLHKESVFVESELLPSNGHKIKL